MDLTQSQARFGDELGFRPSRGLIESPSVSGHSIFRPWDRAWRQPDCEMAGVRLLQITSNLHPAHGSTFTMIPRLCGLLRAAGADVVLMSADDAAIDPKVELRNGFPVHSFPRSRWTGALGLSRSMAADVRRSCGAFDVIHAHGLWSHSSVSALRAARQSGTRAIVSPMGVFARPALRISRFRKMAFSVLCQKDALKEVALFHATSMKEHDDLRAYGIRAPIAVIPPGVDLGAAGSPKPVGQRTVVFLGRICPIKNLHSMLVAWAAVQDTFPDARMRIIGPDYKGHTASLRRAADGIGARRVSIESGVWGRARDLVYRQADILILPSLSESFGLVVAEALSAGVPVIASTGTPWQTVGSSGCGWCVEPTPDALSRALKEALGLSDAALARMGRNARCMAERELSWSTTLPRFARMYQWAARGGSVPEFVSE